jgi:protein-S-isoprenylcysteine O-methyltransferase
VASWTFFKDRIPYEETLLLSFYGDDYRQYAQRTVIGIPFVASPAVAVIAEGSKKKE